MEYLTKEKKVELEDELKNLQSVRRKEIADALEYAKSLGEQLARKDAAVSVVKYGFPVPAPKITTRFFSK